MTIMTIGCEMKKPQYVENPITTTPTTSTGITLVVLGDPFPGPRKSSIRGCELAVSDD